MFTLMCYLFLPRVSPGVCLSVTLLYCVQMAEDIVKLFLGTVAPRF